MFKWLFKEKGCAKHMNNKLEVIGIDHGWSMMKTISQVFVTGVKEITTTPALFGDVLEYEGKFYKVGTVRQEVKDTKVEDDSFYLLTLAAVAKELKRRGLAEAKVFLAVGLPLTRFGAEKNDFIKYLTKNKRVSFKYENEPYYIEMDDVAVFPQCYAAVVDKIPTMAKKTLIVDIGSWTIDIMPVSNGVIYKDVCNPITAEFREELYTNILDAYARIKEPEKEETQKQERTQEMPEFSVTVTPYEREGSNIKGLARIYFENSFIVNNINIVQGKEKIFVSMPSYKTKQVDEQGKPIYQDVCYPVTKDFREKLYNEIISEYEKAKDKSNENARESAEKHHGNPDKEKDKEATPFR